MRLAITGGPGSGKTTLANRLGKSWGARVFHTDDLIDLGWSEASEHAADWLERPGDMIVEGVAVPRALRKWMERHPLGKPIDRLMIADRCYITLSEGQDRMRKGVMTVIGKIYEELTLRGVAVHIIGEDDDLGDAP